MPKGQENKINFISIILRVLVVRELSLACLRPIFQSHYRKARELKPLAHWCVYKQGPGPDMQPAGISCGKETSDDGEKKEGGADEAADDKPKQIVMSPGQVTADVQRGVGDTEVPALPLLVETNLIGLNEKNKKRKTRREKKKLMKKKLKSADSLDSLMLELPFALTSPTTWKELGFPNPEPTQKKRKRKRGDSGGRMESEEDGDNKKKKRTSQRPNYFLSIPITNTEINSGVTEVQQAVLQKEPRLAKAMIPVPTLHITLLVTHLANQEQVDLAATLLAQIEPSLAKLLGGQDLILPFSGISHFRKEVVFVGLAPGQHRHTLDSLAELLRNCFEEHGLLQGDSRGFEPHLTIMKLSRASKLRSQGIKRVDPALYSDYTNKFFGDQMVERVDLCSMLKKKQQDGYYHTESSLPLGGRRRSEPDEAELLRVSRRLVEDAVSRALQQYKQETLQNGGGPNATAAQAPGNTEESATKTDTTANSTAGNRK
ncbi:hypothetical protein Q5P01_005109 [Channa striata]|uniref:A-kinase anchoring protein 7 n=1 Tax=Channa striata TaxID=64152 RepID=A0AA88SZ43_CHASR|nr:hypothetical protein Q5P01_005109 [Channa striata]